MFLFRRSREKSRSNNDTSEQKGLPPSYEPKPSSEDGTFYSDKQEYLEHCEESSDKVHHIGEDSHYVKISHKTISKAPVTPLVQLDPRLKPSQRACNDLIDNSIGVDLENLDEVFKCALNARDRAAAARRKAVRAHNAAEIARSNAEEIHERAIACFDRALEEHDAAGSKREDDLAENNGDSCTDPDQEFTECDNILSRRDQAITRHINDVHDEIMEAMKLFKLLMRLAIRDAAGTGQLDRWTPLDDPLTYNNVAAVATVASDRGMAFLQSTDAIHEAGRSIEHHTVLANELITLVCHRRAEAMSRQSSGKDPVQDD